MGVGLGEVRESPPTILATRNHALLFAQHTCRDGMLGFYACALGDIASAGVQLQ